MNRKKGSFQKQVNKNKKNVPYPVEIGEAPMDPENLEICLRTQERKRIGTFIRTFSKI